MRASQIATVLTLAAVLGSVMVSGPPDRSTAAVKAVATQAVTVPQPATTVASMATFEASATTQVRTQTSTDSAPSERFSPIEAARRFRRPVRMSNERSPHAYLNPLDTVTSRLNDRSTAASSTDELIARSAPKLTL